MADRLDLGERIGPGQQVLTAFKEVALKIGSQAVREHGNRQRVADVAELADLLFGEELGFVDQHAMDLGCLVLFFHGSVQVGVGIESDRIRLQPNARTDFSRAKAIVELRRKQQGAHASFAVVVARLEQDRGLARIHRGVIKVQFRHRRFPSPEVDEACERVRVTHAARRLQYHDFLLVFHPSLVVHEEPP